MYDLQALIDQARRHGVRMTRQRAIVLQALCELDGHGSAEEVYKQATLHRRDLDLSTVYRTLDRLRDLRILSQTDLGRGCAEFEVMTDRPHHHLVCQSCGKVIDLDHGYLSAAARSIRQEFGFEPIFDHFAIFGWCRECRKAEHRGESSTEASESLPREDFV